MRHIFKEAAAFRNFLKKPAARGKILFVRLKVAGKVADFGRKDRDLNLRRAGVGRVGLKFFNYFLFGVFV